VTTATEPEMFPAATGDGAAGGTPSGEEWIIPPTGRTCKAAGCNGVIPDNSHPARKYCDEHFVGNGGSGKRYRADRGGEQAPKLIVDLGGAKKTSAKDKRVAETAAGAVAFMNVVATGLAATGDDVCATAIAGGAKGWGDAVGELSKYQPWLASFFAPVGGESQLGAWLGFLLATGAIALPVLAHHNLLPESIGARVGGVFVAADTVGADGTPVQPAA
jgi:hypothetical protein